MEHELRNQPHVTKYALTLNIESPRVYYSSTGALFSKGGGADSIISETFFQGQTLMDSLYLRVLTVMFSVCVASDGGLSIPGRGIPHLWSDLNVLEVVGQSG